MGSVRHLDHGVNDENGNEGAIGIGTNDRLLHDLFYDDDHLVGGKGDLFLHA
jgi:hypothetical protein